MTNRAVILWTLILFAMVIAVYAAFGPASAQGMQCAKHEDAINALKDKYGEEVVARGMTQGGQMLEMLASPKGSWTALLTNPQGQACMVASGQNWEAVLPGKDA